MTIAEPPTVVGLKMVKAITGGFERTARDKPNGHSRSPVSGRNLDPVNAPDIPARMWAYGKFLLFGAAGVIGAVDGAGKGAIAIGMMLSVITGKPLLGERIWRTGPVAIVSYEDDEEEWLRRITAACLHYGLDTNEILPQIHFLYQPDGGRVTFAEITEGGRVTFPDSDSIIDCIRESGAIMLIIDPFNHCHDIGDGNNNALIARVAGEIFRIARETKSAVLLLHHLRKGSKGDPDDLMGATSLRATFRSCRILQRMTPEQAEKMKLVDPWRYLRIAGSKENYAPPPDKSKWYRLASVDLGNGDETYPDGDEIGVATTWSPPNMFQGLEPAALAAVFRALRAAPHSPRKGASFPYVLEPLMTIGGRSEADAKAAVAAWIKNGVLIEGEQKNAQRNDRKCLSLDEAKADAILAEIGQMPDLSD